MGLEKSNAVILYGRKQGETSKILTVLTQKFGKLTLIAKGSRSMKSKFLGALEPYTVAQIVFYRKENREMQFLSDAAMIQPFVHIHAQLGKMALAAIPCEIIDKSEENEHVNRELYKLLVETLSALDVAASGHKNIIRVFYIRFLKLSGFEIELRYCSGCHKTEVDERQYYLFADGAYYCRACLDSNSDSFVLCKYILELLRWYNTIPLSQAHRARVAMTQGREVDSFLMTNLRYHVEGLENLKSIRYFIQLQSNLKMQQKGKKDGTEN
ncbi:DNA repair protein RecO [candidate division KSB1 bacterium]|nr:DNA repair protein RecO [candidate division KSB1 bacterium]